MDTSIELNVLNPEATDIIEDLGLSHAYTLEMYLAHVARGEWEAAHECLEAARHLADNMCVVEDTDYSYKPLTVNMVSMGEDKLPDES